MSNLGQNVYMDIQPSNIVSTGKVSYRAGNPVVQFIIGENDLHLMGSSVRFCGNITCFRDSAKKIQTEADTNLLCLDPKLGVYSIIDTLTISSQVHKSTIERINNYNRFLASYMPVISSEFEALAGLNATTLVSPNIMTQRLEVVNSTNGSGAVLNYSGSDFCINLPCGLLGGRNPIPLSRANGVGGLMIEIQLAPDSQVFFSNTESSAGLTDAFYELTDLKLIAEAQVVAPGTSVGNTFEYNSIHSYFNSVNSTNAILNFQLGLSNVLGAFVNIVPSRFINNFATDGLITTPLLNADDTVAPVKQIVFTRGGVRYPLMYNLDTNVKDSPLTVEADPQQIKNFVNAITPFYGLKHTQLSPATFTRNIPEKPAVMTQGGSMYGIGVSYDMISGGGLNFQNVNFGLSLETGLTTDSPNALYLFVRNRSTLVFTPNGVQVVA
tara:strand:+ start:2444 stop:3760 length:1317 start_codon:yes stop_codon:yes gene_type:complete